MCAASRSRVALISSSRKGRSSSKPVPKRIPSNSSAEPSGNRTVEPVDLGQPRPHGDTPLADEGQVVLVERDAGDRQRLRRGRRSVLLGLPPASTTISLS